MEPEQSDNPEAATIGLAFARALVNGQFDIAYGMLAPSLRNKCQPEDLKSDYEQMTSYWDAPADHVEVTSVGEHLTIGRRKMKRTQVGYSSQLTRIQGAGHGLKQ